MLSQKKKPPPKEQKSIQTVSSPERKIKRLESGSRNKTGLPIASYLYEIFVNQNLTVPTTSEAK